MMGNSGIDERLRGIEERLERLERGLERIEGYLDFPGPKADVTPSGAVSEDMPDVSEEVLRWVGKAAVLPRVAALSFILVIALLLRTLAQKGVIEPHTGAFAGIAYAFFLMVAGWLGYVRNNVLAPVFAVSGAILLSGIVVETHSRFHTLSSEAAYVSLAATASLMAFVGKRFAAPVPIAAGLLGMCISAAVIDYPEPFFPYVILLLGATSILGYIAATIFRCIWIRVIVLTVTQFLLILWSVKLGQALLRSATDATARWFFPEATFLGLLYPLLGYLEIQRKGVGRISRFAFFLPVVSAMSTFPAVVYVVFASGKSLTAAGAVGALGAALHVAVVFWLVQQNGRGAPGVASFAAGAVGYFIIALPLVMPIGWAIMPVCAIAATGLALLSDRWGSGGARLLSYGGQLLTAIACLLWLKVEAQEIGWIDAAATGIMTISAFYHYHWVRSTLPPPGLVYFQKYDPEDMAGSLVMLAALLDLFLLVQAVVGQFALTLNVRMGVQTVTVAIIAAAVMAGGYILNDRRFRNIAIFLMAITGAKVFTHDLIRMHGLSLVLSMLSFGLLVAMESFLLSLWSNKNSPRNS